MPLFEKQVELNTTAQELFDFLIRPENVLKINPKEMQMNFLDVPDVLEEDSELEVELLGFGIPQRVKQQITDFNNPTLIEISQIEGPLSKWIHQHEISEGPNGGVTLTERIDFEPPGGMIGMMITADKIMGYLNKGFSHRHDSLSDLYLD